MTRLDFGASSTRPDHEEHRFAHDPTGLCDVRSPSTARYDLVQKLRTLPSAGVPYYWIVDPEHGTLTVYRHIPAAYLIALTAGAGDIVNAEPFEAVAIDIERLMG